MFASVDELEQAILQLQPQLRAELLRRLLKTFDADQIELSEEQWLELWADEADRRIEEIESGRVIPLDGQAVINRWRERYP